MRAIWPLLKREYLSRVRTKAFWISTLLFPLLIGGLMIGPSLLAARAKSRPEPILIVDMMGDFFPALRDAISKSRSKKQNAAVELEKPSDRSVAEIKRALNEQAEKGEIQGYLIVDEKSLESGELTYFARNPSSEFSDGWFEARVREAATRYRLTRLGLDPGQVDTATRRLDLDVRKATNDPRKQSRGPGEFILSFLMVMFIYATLIMYGMYVLRGVLEEKSNRIVEIIVSSVKPFHMMVGKIVGIGAVGLTQIAIWLAFTLMVSAPQVLTALAVSSDLVPRLSMMTLLFFPVYFILGFFLFATIYAGVGSMFNSEEDAQQMASSVVMLIVVPIALTPMVMKNPSGTMSVVLSMIPFFAPILMYLRITVEPPPVWQISLSIVIMLATILVMIWVVSKIYRIGILMYGKKPTVPEILRWLKYT